MTKQEMLSPTDYLAVELRDSVRLLHDKMWNIVELAIIYRGSANHRQSQYMNVAPATEMRSTVRAFKELASTLDCEIKRLSILADEIEAEILVQDDPYREEFQETEEIYF